MTSPPRPTLPVPVILAIVGGGLMLLGMGLVVVLSAVVYTTVRARAPASRFEIHYAEVETTRAPQPTRFAAPLPRLRAWQAFVHDDPRFPPYAHVRDALCAGDVAVRAEWLTALRAEAKRGAPPTRLVETYGQIGRWCDGEAHCRATLALLDAGEPPGVRSVLWQSLVSCGGEDVVARFARRDAPRHLRVEFLRNCRYRDPPCVLDARAESALAAACRREPDHYSCRPAAPLDEPAIDWERPLSELARDARVEIDEMKARFAARADELKQALASCARRAEWAWRRSDCAADLATLDWGEARALARKIDPGDDIFAREVQRTLVRFASALEVREYLLGLDLISGERGTEGAVTPRAFIMQAGRQYHFDVETGFFPNEHDSLARALIARLMPELKDVVFEEVAPEESADADDEEDEDDEEAEDYVLRAYFAGLCHTVYPKNLGDWYDVAAVVGLLNVLARQVESDQRLVMLATGDQNALVLAGREASLTSAIRDGLLVVDSTAQPQ